MKHKRRMYLWTDVLWLSLALTVMLAGCAAVAALDTYEEAGGCASPAPTAYVENEKIIATLEYMSGLDAVDEPMETFLPPCVHESEKDAGIGDEGAARIVPRPANPWGVPLFDEEMEALYETCEAYRMAPELGLALIWVESRYDREAVNGDCYGLCQLKEKYFPGASSMTGAENIRAGVAHLGELLEKYENLDAALCAYRWGSDTGNRRYAGEVLAKREEFVVECY